MLKEFKEFALKGNMVDMAVGIIIGGAFGTIIKSLVDDIMMPPLGMLTGGMDFREQFLVLKPGATEGPYASLAAAKGAGATVLAYGSFITNLMSFVILAFAVFMMVKAMNRVRSQAPAAPPATRECPYCLSSIPLKATRCPACTATV
ncbi:MAG: large conductance mechanosensitive channel protein MscL [Gemmatimonadales bacterium]